MAQVIRTPEFEQWSQTLRPELRHKLEGTIKRICAGGPTLGRPRVDTLDRTRLHKLKEARVDRGTRALFAFDSRQNLVMLIGGDKTGRWNRWYPAKINQAEQLYDRHERTQGRGVQCLNRANHRQSQDRGRGR